MTESTPATTPEAIARVERLKTMTADKVAPMVAFLCSDAAHEMSGQVLCVRKNELFLFRRRPDQHEPDPQPRRHARAGSA